MNNGLKDLLESERGVLCILLVLASTILVIMGKLSASDWVTYTQWIAVTLVASKTVTGAIETIVQSQKQPLPAARVVPPPP